MLNEVHLSFNLPTWHARQETAFLEDGKPQSLIFAYPPLHTWRVINAVGEDYKCQIKVAPSRGNTNTQGLPRTPPSSTQYVT